MHIHCKKKSVQITPNMVCYVCPVWNTLYGVKLCQIFGVCFTPNWVCFHTNSVCFPTNFSVFSHSLWRIFTLSIYAAVSAIIRAYTNLPGKVSQVHRNTITKCLSLVHQMPSSTTLHYIFHCIKQSTSHSYTFTLTTAMQEQKLTFHRLHKRKGQHYKQNSLFPPRASKVML